MNARTVARRAVLFGLAAVVLVYVVELLGGVAVGIKRQGASQHHLVSVFRALCEYHEAKGRWPGSLLDAAGCGLIGESWTVDPISHRPLLYHPEAEAGTNAILLAQPEAVRIGLWPFVATRRLGVQADGEVVGLPAHDARVDEAK
jgi:hypothetical protein